MEHLSIKQAAAFLTGCDGYLIYTHASPDGDTIGSATALALILRKLGKTANAFSVDGIPEKLDFIPTGDVFLTDEPDDTSKYTLISVDVAGPKMLVGAKNRSFALSIDHHKVNTIECERLLVMSDRIACGEIIFMLMEELGVEKEDILYFGDMTQPGGNDYPVVQMGIDTITVRSHEDTAYALRGILGFTGNLA